LIRKLPDTIGEERALQELSEFLRFGVELAGQDARTVVAVPQLGLQVVDRRQSVETRGPIVPVSISTPSPGTGADCSRSCLLRIQL
jgi:hypothetical protein